MLCDYVTGFNKKQIYGFWDVKHLLLGAQMQQCSKIRNEIET